MRHCRTRSQERVANVLSRLALAARRPRGIPRERSGRPRLRSQCVAERATRKPRRAHREQCRRSRR
eukprot:3845930-Pleurochrysis_carterae.AAC.1